MPVHTHARAPRGAEARRGSLCSSRPCRDGECFRWSHPSSGARGLRSRGRGPRPIPCPLRAPPPHFPFSRLVLAPPSLRAPPRRGARPLPPVTPMLTEAALSRRCGEGWWLVPLCLQLCPLVGDSEGRWRCEGARVCDVAGSVTSLQQVPPAGNSAQDFRRLGGSGLWGGNLRGGRPHLVQQPEPLSGDLGQLSLLCSRRRAMGTAEG